MRQRLALWGALVTVVVVAVMLVVVARSGDDGDLPQLPLAAGTDGGAGRGADMGAHPVSFSAVTYVPSDDLPTLGGDGPSYRLGGSDEADVRALAEALGIDAAPTEVDGSWRAEGDDLVLDVWGPDGAWSTYPNDAYASEDSAPDAEAPQATTFPPTTTSVPAPDEPVAPVPGCMEPPPGYPDADSSTDTGLLSLDCEQPPVGPSGAETGEPVPADPMPVESQPSVRPADLPTEAEARTIAVDYLARTGVDVEDAEVIVEDGITEWFVTVEPRVEGLPVPWMTSSAIIGSGSRVTSASGYLTPAERLGDYPLIDTRAALDRLNTGWFVGGPETLTVEPDRAGSDQPDQPDQLDQPQTTEVVVSDAEVVLVSVPSWDGSGTYLVPGYRFRAEDGSEPTVPAVGDDVLAPPPASDVGPSTTVGELSPPTEPAPAPDPTTRPGPTVVDPAPSDGETIDVALYHCGFEEVRKDGRRWVVVSPPFDATNAPPELVGRGTFVVQDSGRTAVYTDPSGIVLDFTQVNEAWEFPPCA